jgi:hypothetical protein
VNCFGLPAEGDEYKVLGSYSFTDDLGSLCTLYDWKATSLFDEESEIPRPTPQEFWANDKPAVFQIGGRENSDVDAFKAWLESQLI